MEICVLMSRAEGQIWTWLAHSLPSSCMFLCEALIPSGAPWSWRDLRGVCVRPGQGPGTKSWLLWSPRSEPGIPLLSVWRVSATWRFSFVWLPHIQARSYLWWKQVGLVPGQLLVCGGPQNIATCLHLEGRGKHRCAWRALLNRSLRPGMVPSLLGWGGKCQCCWKTATLPPSLKRHCTVRCSWGRHPRVRILWAKPFVLCFPFRLMSS